jgi:hypothetical protein
MKTVINCSSWWSFAIGALCKSNLLTMHDSTGSYLKAYLRTVSMKAMWLEMDDWIREGWAGQPLPHIPSSTLA